MSDAWGTYDYMWSNLDDEFERRLVAFINASGGRIRLISGWRSDEQQQVLYDRAVAKYGAENAGKWAAPPGHSNHNRGLAGDLRFVGDDAKNWAHDNAARFGLEFPMGHEPWHVEPAGLRAGTFQSKEAWKEAYTTPPPGMPGAMDFGASVTQAGVLRNLFAGPIPAVDEVTAAKQAVAGPTGEAPPKLGAFTQLDQPEEVVTDGTTG